MQTVVSKSKRIDELDILKALGIICMVAGHSSAPFTHFIYLFHMAVFFIASGFVFKKEASDTIRSVFHAVTRKIKQLWIPFFVWNTIYVLLHNVFIRVNIYTNDPSIYNYVSGPYIRTIDPYSGIDMVKRIIKGAAFGCKESMFGANWFLKVLFMVSVSYLVFDWLAKKASKKHAVLIQLAISLCLLTLGYYCSLHGVSAKGLAQTASFYCLYFLGHILAENKEKYINWGWEKWLTVFGVSLCILLLLNGRGAILLDQNTYENPVFLIASSFAGWVFLYSIAFFIKKSTPLKTIMLAIGRRTLTIVVLHFLSFKIVELAVVLFYNLPACCLAAFPNLFGGRGMWWLAYTVVGVGVPVCLNMFYHKLTENAYSLLRKHKAIKQ